jgi:hypothetical protein
MHMCTCGVWECISSGSTFMCHYLNMCKFMLMSVYMFRYSELYYVSYINKQDI